MPQAGCTSLRRRGLPLAGTPEPGWLDLRPEPPRPLPPWPGLRAAASVIRREPPLVSAKSRLASRCSARGRAAASSLRHRASPASSRRFPSPAVASRLLTHGCRHPRARDAAGRLPTALRHCSTRRLHATRHGHVSHRVESPPLRAIAAPATSEPLPASSAGRAPPPRPRQAGLASPLWLADPRSRVAASAKPTPTASPGQLRSSRGRLKPPRHVEPPRPGPPPRLCRSSPPSTVVMSPRSCLRDAPARACSCGHDWPPQRPPPLQDTAGAPLSRPGPVHLVAHNLWRSHGSASAGPALAPPTRLTGLASAATGSPIVQLPPVCSSSG